jgi:mannose-1-phosphate guanylyltransferase
MLHAVIMAGGTGTRFWPESRARRPKQLLPLVGSKTMVRTTVERLAGLAPPERIVVATTAELAESIAEELPELPRAAILAEPMKRNTAACIGLAAIRVGRDDPEATMAAMPADHAISPVEAFHDAIRFAAALVEEQPERIVTFGVRPTYPAESFGYIERGERLEGPGDELKAACGFAQSPGRPPESPPPAAYRVRRFHEKPDAATARQYLDSGAFSWNAGIFVWRAATILAALAEHQPALHERLVRIAEAAGSPGFDDVLRREFAAMPSISIDHAVLERAAEVVVVEAPFDWDDVGSWQAIGRLSGADAEGNTIQARHVGLYTRGTVVRGPDDHLIATLGLVDCIIVHTPDATLVADKHDEESVRALVEWLEKRGWTEYL